MAIIVGELQEARSSSKKTLMQQGDIIADINQGRFAIAEEKMLALHEPAIVGNIVRDMSANSDHDFGVLVDLAKGLNNTSLRSRILLNLYHQAKEGDHISPQNLIALAKCLSEKGDSYQRGRVIGISAFNKLLDQITKSTIATFVDVMKWKGDYQTNSEVRAIAEDIAEWGDVSEKVMIGLVSGVFETVDSNKIFKAVCNHSDTWQALLGVDTLIERLKSTDSLKGTIAWGIAAHLNEFVTRSDLGSTVQDYARRVMDKIPDCITKLTIFKNVCIRSKYKIFFLIASGHFYEAPHDIVVLGPRWCKNNTQYWASWRHQRKDDRLFFENIAYGANLYASNITLAGFHTVFVSPKQGNLDDKNAWIIEPAGGGCFLKNYSNNEYLLASDEKMKGSESKFAGTGAKRSGSADDNPDFVWQIVDC